MNFKYCVRLFIFIVLLGSISVSQQSAKQAEQVGSGKKHVMVVMIHGTIIPFPSFKALGASWHKNGEHDSSDFAQRYIDYYRQRSIYKCQPIGPKGLIEVTQAVSGSISPFSFPLTDQLEECYEVAQPGIYASVKPYLYGWDGRLCRKNRKMWGKKLYQALIAERTRLQEKFKGDAIKIHIYAHSHGGNVALYLAEIEKELRQKLSIDRLVTIGTPIQHETSESIKDPIFKQSFNIFSCGDGVQIADMISSKRWVPGRRFKSDHSNLTQIEVVIEKGYRPAHAELFMCGAKACHAYTKKMPLKPFPVFTFLPVVFKTVHTSKIESKRLKATISCVDDECTVVLAPRKCKTIKKSSDTAREKAKGGSVSKSYKLSRLKHNRKKIFSLS